MTSIVEEVVDTADGPLGVVFELVMTDGGRDPRNGDCIVTLGTRVLATYHFPRPLMDEAPMPREPEK